MADLVERLNKFLYESDFVTEESLNADIARVATETGLSADDVKKVMMSVLNLMEEKRTAAGVDSDKIGKGYAYGAYIVRRPQIFRRWR